MKKLIKQREGFTRGKQGLLVMVQERGEKEQQRPSKTKSMTLHGYSLEELYDTIWFSLNHDIQRHNKEKEWEKNKIQIVDDH